MKRALFGSIMTVITIVAAVIGLINYITNANTTYFSGLGKDPVVIGCTVIGIAALALWLVLGEPKASWKDILPAIAPACLIVAALTLVNSRIKSMESGGMLEHLSKKYDGLALSYRTSEEKYRELDGQCRELQEKIEAHEQAEVPEQDKLPSEIRELLSRLRFTKDMLAPAKKDLEKLTAERDEAKKAYDEASVQMKSVEERYLPRKEKYESLLRQKSEITEKLNELESKQATKA